ncbi:hypothetical protein K402DRAFT_366325 [Aulographum hederae CBS 113979]|uniref:Phytanoyl-CoA dioxygenase n=1 Tax=Aulographum hederae CBS 113979 TaxID=1176131 RepID=A0A6G1HGF0_9PEZI|nr:hypothetical protein K402DRAFT_366325 [Aulographum hederae CBS 113979]
MAVTLPPPPPSPIDPAYHPKSAIASLDANSPIEKILEILDRDGGVILTNLVTEGQLNAMDRDVAACRKKNPVSNSSGIPIIPKETFSIGGLVGKSQTAADVCEHPLLEELRTSILEDRYTIRREEYDEHNRIDPLLSISMTFYIGYGAPRQRLHRDDNIHGVKHGQKPFQLNKASQFACLVAGCKTTRENGATMFVPGSHLWDDDRRPRTDEICFAEMDPGSALIFLGSAYHGGGHNSVPDSIRKVHGFFFVRGTLRQEENQFLAIPRSKVLTMSENMQALLGYRRPTIALGLVDNQDPLEDLQGVLERANQ